MTRTLTFAALGALTLGVFAGLAVADTPVREQARRRDGSCLTADQAKPADPATQPAGNGGGQRLRKRDGSCQDNYESAPGQAGNGRQPGGCDGSGRRRGRGCRP